VLTDLLKQQKIHVYLLKGAFMYPVENTVWEHSVLWFFVGANISLL